LVRRDGSVAANSEEKQMLQALGESQKEAGPTVELLPSLRELNEKLKKEIEAGRLEVKLERRGLVISLREATFFPSGTDLVEESTIPTLAVIAEELKQTPNPIRLEGHTDSVPISNMRFRSNWDLAAARGIAMLDLFQKRFGVAVERMAIAGFADTAPIASNETAGGRARNRRVDIVVLNEEASLAQPVQMRTEPSATGP
jgi:chemotaxis protein MotB